MKTSTNFTFNSRKIIHIRDPKTVVNSLKMNKIILFNLCPLKEKKTQAIPINNNNNINLVQNYFGHYLRREN